WPPHHRRGDRLLLRRGSTGRADRGDDRVRHTGGDRGCLPPRVGAARAGLADRRAGTADAAERAAGRGLPAAPARRAPRLTEERLLQPGLSCGFGREAAPAVIRAKVVGLVAVLRVGGC